jgi:ribonucleoside-diphosphate reductase alpha chain
MGTIEDSIPGIFRALEEGAVTMQRGGGVGYDFSTIRPSGARSRTTGAIASGPVSFMDVWDAMCATIQSIGARRGAMMATLRCDHPDIVAFIDAKRRTGRLRHFNLSVQVSDAFMQAVERDEDWPLVFPESRVAGTGSTVMRAWPGEASTAPCRIVRRMAARGLWDSLLRASYDTGEPGMLFIDRINRMNNLWYCENITATNPCGEVPLPPYGACDLGAINLTRLIRDPFSPRARLDSTRLTTIASTAVRLLDNVIDVSRFPLPQQQIAVRKARRVGLGITGLADAFIMLGMRYGDDASLAFAGEIMRTICHTAYRASIHLAHEKGCFPDFDRERYLEAPFIRGLPADLRDGIGQHGIRNSHLLAIAPTGTISLLAGNVSSGIEPVFAPEYRRTVLEANGAPREFSLRDYAVRLWRKQSGRSGAAQDILVTTAALPIEAHLATQAALQDFVDNSISKTVQVPQETQFTDFAPIYRLAYDRGLKGCTTFRPIATRDTVLATVPKPNPLCRSGECE